MDFSEGFLRSEMPSEAPTPLSFEPSIPYTPDNDDDNHHESSEAELGRAMVMADLALLLARTTHIEVPGYRDNPLLVEPINLERPPYATNLQSPTPLDPDHVLINGIAYRTHAYGWMGQRFYDVQDKLAAAGVVLDDVYVKMITEEIDAQHGIRCEQNQGAYERLLRAIKENPARLTPVYEYTMPQLRSGFASTLDRVRLLTAFPEMRSIEDMKDTAVFDERGYIKRRSAYIRNLMGLNLLPSVTVRPCEDTNDRQWLDVVDPRGTILIKQKIAEITSSGVTLDVMERRSYSALPTKPQLRGISEQLKRLPGSDEQVNLQLIGGSVYLRTRQASLDDDDPENMSSMLYVDNPPHLYPM